MRNRSLWHRLAGIECIGIGFPCQPHSSLGKQQAINDPRDLLHTILALMEFLRPPFVVLENVMGFFDNLELI